MFKYLKEKRKLRKEEVKYANFVRRIQNLYEEILVKPLLIDIKK
jgi:hypothetical protein